MDNLISNKKKIYQDLACGNKTIKYEFHTQINKDYPIRTLYIQDTALIGKLFQYEHRNRFFDGKPYLFIFCLSVRMEDKKMKTTKIYIHCIEQFKNQ